MAFYGSIKAFINFRKLLHSPILSSPCWEVKLFMWLPIGYVDCVLKGTTSRALCFPWRLGGRLWGRQERCGYPEGHHLEGLIGPLRQSRRSLGGQGNCWTNIPAQGKGTVDFNNVHCGNVSTCVCTHICVHVSSSTRVSVDALNMKIKYCLWSSF